MPPPAKDQVFISYSHEDTKWRDDLDISLKPYLRDGSIITWSDKQITPGSEWYVLVVGQLAFEMAQQGGVRILWVPVRASAYKRSGAVPRFRRYCLH